MASRKNTIKVERFINQLMGSNCYLVVDAESSHCLCIDPASEKSEQEITYIEEKGLTLDNIILTHEHTDHTWGVNALVDRYPFVKVICSELCKAELPKDALFYFQLYYDNPNYSYNVKRVDCTTEELNWHLSWEDHEIHFIATPGHSPGSICIAIENMIFGGDTLMPFKPYVKERNGGSIELFQKSIKKISENYPDDMMVYPGHGEMGILKDYKQA